MIFGGQYFYHQIIRKMVVVFGSIFQDIYIKRVDADNNETELVRVPISYSVKEKMLARLNSDPDLNRPYSALLPRLSFEIVTMSYNAHSHLPTLNRSVGKSTDPNKLQQLYTPVAYDIIFALHIYVKNQEDGTKILEQILPFFTPDWTATVELISDENMVEIRDIPFTLNTVQIQDTYTDDFKQRTILLYTLTFTCHTYLYGPIKVKPAIKFTEIRNYIGLEEDNANTDSQIETVTLQPGLLANGQPTSNASLSIDWNLISVDDDFGFAFERTDNA